jgi:hypothetical protein
LITSCASAPSVGKANAEHHFIFINLILLVFNGIIGDFLSNFLINSNFLLLTMTSLSVGFKNSNRATWFLSMTDRIFPGTCLMNPFLYRLARHDIRIAVVRVDERQLAVYLVDFYPNRIVHREAFQLQPIGFPKFFVGFPKIKKLAFDGFIFRIVLRG